MGAKGFGRDIAAEEMGQVMNYDFMRFQGPSISTCVPIGNFHLCWLVVDLSSCFSSLCFF